MEKALADLVRRRSAGVCEYCHHPRPPYQFEHVVAIQHRGETEPDNLALACLRCNLNKGPNLSAIDPDSGAIVPLFNPRTQVWRAHFCWDGPLLIGITPFGRATIEVLDINSVTRVAAREALIIEGWLPA